jgi:ABC-2 type transport system ATP-binding protein
VAFSVRDGEVLGLIGPNGSGKTTLFECLAGLMPVASGAARHRGRYLPIAKRNRVLFYLPDAIAPWKEQSVSWILSFFAHLYPNTKLTTTDLVEPLRLKELLHTSIGTLSKGERKRTLLAAALLTDQPLLLLDEPFDGLDLRQTRDVMEMLRGHSASGRTLMLSIHQLADAARVCDRFVLLSGGRTVAEGSITESREQVNLPQAGVEEIFLALTDRSSIAIERVA